jgi:hypothetical protein
MSQFESVSLPLSVFVNDSTVFLPYENFDEEILFSKVKKTESYSEYPFDLVISIRDSLKSIDLARMSINTKIEGLSLLSTSKKSNFIIFFSSPYKNTIVAKILFDPLKKRDYKEVILTNQLSLDFLFVFNDKEEISYVFSRTIGYD